MARDRTLRRHGCGGASVWERIEGKSGSLRGHNSVFCSVDGGDAIESGAGELVVASGVGAAAFGSALPVACGVPLGVGATGFKNSAGGGT